MVAHMEANRVMYNTKLSAFSDWFWYYVDRFLLVRDCRKVSKDPFDWGSRSLDMVQLGTDGQQ